MASKVKVTPYVQRVAASDNLKFALDGGTQHGERPLGAVRRGGERSRAGDTGASPRSASRLNHEIGRPPRADWRSQ